MATSDALFKQQLCGLLMEQLGQQAPAGSAATEHNALRLVREFMARQGGDAAAAAMAMAVAAAAPSRKRKKPLNPLLMCEPRDKIINPLFMGRREE